MDNNWISTLDRLPEKTGKYRYEQIGCLVYHNGSVKMLVWNCEHDCWDDADGDDYFCDSLSPSHWMPLPSPPNTSKS